jgi:hypothetical protein
MRKLALVVITACVGLSGLRAQTTQGLISGRILDSVTGQAVAGASVSYSSETLSSAGTLKSDASGYYFLPLLSAGTYTIRAGGDKYQPQELQQLELPVAGRIQLDFRLRPLSDVWEAGQYRSVFLPGTKTIVTLYGPDVDPSKSGTFEAVKGQRGTLDTSASYVIDPTEIGDLPLLGRDVYAMLVSLPTVGADSATGRGLGVSVAGQRPSSSNYLLDGVENDNYLITGPLVTTTPEAIQEYRISTNNYSAEYGRTAGFVANAVTRAGSAQYHGTGYEYLKNTALDAADFQDNLIGAGRNPDRENEFGYQAGGPVVPKGSLRSRLFFSSALDELISHSNQAPTTYLLPTTSFLTGFTVPTTRLASQLLTQYPGPVIKSAALEAKYSIAQPVVVDRLVALERGDYTTKSGRDHFVARLAISRTNEPDFIWTPYTEFNSALHENTTGIAGNWQRSWTPRITSELKFSYTDDNLWWDRAHPEIPTLLTNADPVNQLPLTLPGSPAFYAYRNHNKTPEIIFSTVWTRNRHIITAGLGLLFRYNSGYLTAGQGSVYGFSSPFAFATDSPYTFFGTVDPLSPTMQPDYNRAYRYAQSYFFVQDSYRVSQRLTLNFGIRYENFGAPVNTNATKDEVVTLGSGGNLTAALANANLTLPGAGDQQLYGSDNKDWAPRFGFSWDPLGKSKTLVRGGFGIFYDRPFDNLWQNVRNNSDQVNTYDINSPATNYLQPASTALRSYRYDTLDIWKLTLLDPKLKNGYTQSSFLGVQQQVTDSLTVEVNGTSALGRRLITTDVVNRYFTTDFGLGAPNASLPPAISWRSDQGLSDYYALSTLVRYRRGALLLQGAYTWSHSIDNQSDPLQGDFFSLDFTSLNGGGGNGPVSAFAKQYDSNGDRGNSEFDQRHNLFLLGTWQPQSRWRLARGWQMSFLAAFRSGTPYTVYAPSQGIPDSGGTIENQRADLLNPAGARLASPTPGPGGVYLLNPAAFGLPGAGDPGTSGRNQFAGPGLYSLDTSLARSFRVPKLREGTFFTFRADFFNVLNHANLGNPDNLLGDPNFGLSTYGRQGVASGFPAVAPLNETARQIQILMRLVF